jgi:hypothetical protein
MLQRDASALAAARQHFKGKCEKHQMPAPEKRAGHRGMSGVRRTFKRLPVSAQVKSVSCGESVRSRRLTRPEIEVRLPSALARKANAETPSAD